jgi:hypothetical protein
MKGMLTLVICNTEKLHRGEKLTTMLSLPAADEQFREAANAVGLTEFEYGKYHYDEWSFDEGMEKLNSFIDSTSGIRKLNLMAHVLTGFSEEQLQQYAALIAGCDMVSADRLINEAYNIKDGQYEFWPAYDFEGIGRYYVGTELHCIPEALEGYIDFEQAGRDFQRQEGGRFTDGGYICNGNSDFPSTFDGTNLDKLLAKARKEIEKSQQMEGMKL